MTGYCMANAPYKQNTKMCTVSVEMMMFLIRTCLFNSCIMSHHCQHSNSLSQSFYGNARSLTFRILICNKFFFLFQFIGERKKLVFTAAMTLSDKQNCFFCSCCTILNVPINNWKETVMPAECMSANIRKTIYEARTNLWSFFMECSITPQ